MEDDFTSHADAMLVESTPLDNVGLEDIVDFRHELEGQGLRGKSAEAYTDMVDVARLAFRMVVAGMQCVSRSYSLARTCKMR